MLLIVRQGRTSLKTFVRPFAEIKKDRSIDRFRVLFLLLSLFFRIAEKKEPISLSLYKSRTNTVTQIINTLDSAGEEFLDEEARTREKLASFASSAEVLSSSKRRSKGGGAFL